MRKVIIPLALLAFSFSAFAEERCLSREIKAQPPSTKPVTDPRISRLVWEIFQWFDEGYVPMPSIKQANASFMIRKWEKTHNITLDCDIGIGGLYYREIDPKTQEVISRTIYISDEFDVHDPIDKASLVHEIEHHIRLLKDENALVPMSVCEAESRAYRAERKWLLEKEGFQPDDDAIFNLDGFIAAYELDCSAETE